MENKNIETDFVKFIIDKYSPNPGATASQNDREKDSDEEDEDKDEEVNEVSSVIRIHKIQILNDRIRGNRKKLAIEKDSKKRQILNLQIWIDQYQIRMTQLKS